MVDQEKPPLIREAMAEGIFYPFDKEEIISAIAMEFQKSTITLKDHTRFILLPWGDLETMGSIIAPVFSLLKKGQIKRIVLLGEAHTPEHGIYLPESEAYTTQLGSSPVDFDGREIIANSSLLFKFYDLPHLDELTFDLSLVLTHYYEPNLPIIPLLVSGLNNAQIRSLTAALKSLEQEAPGETLYLFHGNFRLQNIGNELYKQNLRSLMVQNDIEKILEMCRQGNLQGDGLISLAVMATLCRRAEPSIHRNETGIILVSF